MFASLEQRMVHTYIDRFPPFVPDTDAPVSSEAQAQFYRFVQGMYQTLYAQPGLLFAVLRDDDAYPNRYNRSAYGQPALYNHMKSDLEKIDDWLAFLFEAGRSGAVTGDGLVLDEVVKVKEAHRQLLPEVGLSLEGRTLSHSELPLLFDAWAWMATRQGADITRFSRCLFDDRYRYMQDVYTGMFGDAGAFEQLVAYLDGHGYVCHQAARASSTLDYCRDHGKTPTPPGNPLYADPDHTGVSFDYQPDAAAPQYTVLRMPGYRTLLPRFDTLPAGLQAFLWARTRRCDDCGYCTQTDKTGTRQPLAIATTFGKETARLCPLYTGFSFTFERLTPALVDDVIAYLAFTDG